MKMYWFKRIILSILFILFGIYLINKSFELITTLLIQDGDGTGLYFSFIEINDRLKFEQIPVTATVLNSLGVLLIVTVIFVNVYLGRAGKNNK